MRESYGGYPDDQGPSLNKFNIKFPIPRSIIAGQKLIVIKILKHQSIEESILKLKTSRKNKYLVQYDKKMYNLDMSQFEFQVFSLIINALGIVGTLAFALIYHLLQQKTTTENQKRTTETILSNTDRISNVIMSVYDKTAESVKIITKTKDELINIRKVFEKVDIKGLKGLADNTEETGKILGRIAVSLESLSKGR